MGFMDSVNKWKERLRLDDHHRIERFGIATGVFAVSAAVLIPATGVAAYQSAQEDLSATALYTAEFESSISETNGEVAGVYVSPDRSRSLLLMQINDLEENTAFSTNAENYETFVTGTTPNLTEQDLETTVDGNVVLFGNTGYIGVVLNSDEPFPEQILNIVVRNNSDAAVGAGDGEDELGEDTTFADFDQWRLFFNPGAQEAMELDSLEGRGVDAELIYYEVVLRSQENALRNQLDEQLAQMQGQLGTISELESELDRTNVDGVSIVPPEVPEQIAGDYVTGDLGAEFSPEDETDEGIPEDPEANMGPGTLSDEQIPREYTESDLELETEWVDASGFDFDWRGADIYEGYLDDLVPEGESAATYLQNKEAGIADGVTPEDMDSDEIDAETPNVGDEQESFDVNSITWELDDGTDMDEDEVPAGLEPLDELRNSLSQAYQSYYDLKSEYQTELYPQLLALELQLSQVESSQSVNTTDEAVQPY